jgi:glycosyltransferase involved in cell wall biosynthesis
MLEKKILVSIVVITYNSSKYILETLESIKQQTYKNLELIITDDCSKDNTVVLCQDWLDVNKHGFIRTKLITTPPNKLPTININT